MSNWTHFFSERKNVIHLNGSLSSALEHCPLLEIGGWRFRCVACHVPSGASPAGSAGPLESDNEYQIRIALSGRFGLHSPRAKEIAIQNYGAAVVPGKLPHRWTCLKTGVLIVISLQFLPTPESMRLNGKLIDRMLRMPGGPLKEKVEKLLASGLQDRDPSLHSTATACHLFLLLAAILREIAPRRGTAREIPGKISSEVRGREIVAWIMRHVDENMRNEMAHNQIAKEAGVSGRQLHRLFLKYVGKSFHDYLLGRRLEEAQQLLLQAGQERSIKEIAFACGFSSLSYFSTSFRKIYGLSPSQMLGRGAGRAESR